MIYVDEDDPIEDDDILIPYRDVKVKHNVDPKTDYDIIKDEELGRGSYGTVYLCREKSSGHEFAAKYVHVKNKEERRNMENEIDIMSCLHHPRIIQLYDAFDNGKTICVMLELISGGELFERVIDEDFVLTEKACVAFMRQICDGVGYIHSQSIIHLDLKPENILCLTKTGNRIKLIDFGMARRFDPAKKLKVLFGTPEFTAPEVVNFDEISFYTDMWSLGSICYLLLSGISPFYGDTDLESMTKVTVGKYDFDDEAFNNISQDAKDFIKSLLVMDGKKRLTAAQCLEHTWLKKSPKQTTALSTTKAKLKKFVIRKRWIKAVNTIIALQKMGAKIDFDLV
ncbi:myosin light chain kinase, smooth muscle-like [Condylostylus longicornis]|uniref:myosin light chain kinase, smooth muscle-like n=1 Tax=Condylostylus longicornis TaxID=2530218 RepID=UPI00244DFE0F|nr:myosin light chain kinase, smooth muscle-like [Condylostylus longicornis]